MVQQMIQNDPNVPPQMRQSIQQISQNPAMLQQVSQMMSDPNMRQQMQNMMASGGAGGPNFGGMPNFGAPPQPTSNNNNNNASPPPPRSGNDQDQTDDHEGHKLATPAQHIVQCIGQNHEQSYAGHHVSRVFLAVLFRVVSHIKWRWSKSCAEAAPCNFCDNTAPIDRRNL